MTWIQDGSTHEALAGGFGMVVKDHGSIMAELYFNGSLIDAWYHCKTVDEAKSWLVEVVKDECEGALRALEEDNV